MSEATELLKSIYAQRHSSGYEVWIHPDDLEVLELAANGKGTTIGGMKVIVDETLAPGRPLVQRLGESLRHYPTVKR